MLNHPAIVALAAAVFDLLALGPVPDAGQRQLQGQHRARQAVDGCSNGRG